MEGDSAMREDERGDMGGSASASGMHFSRRTVLRTGSVGLAVGAISVVPGVSGLLGSASAAAPELSGAAGEAADIDGPIVAHITDAATGEVSIYVGERQITYRDAVLVRHLLRAAR